MQVVNKLPKFCQPEGYSKVLKKEKEEEKKPSLAPFKIP
jgi:hypothetical protein